MTVRLEKPKGRVWGLRDLETWEDAAKLLEELEFEIYKLSLSSKKRTQALLRTIEKILNDHEDRLDELEKAG